jgi:hypothetical protein
VPRVKNLVLSCGAGGTLVYVFILHHCYCEFVGYHRRGHHRSNDDSDGFRRRRLQDIRPPVSGFRALRGQCSKSNRRNVDLRALARFQRHLFTFAQELEQDKNRG